MWFKLIKSSYTTRNFPKSKNRYTFLEAKISKIYLMLLILPLYFYGLAQPGTTTTPQSIVVNPEASFEVEVWIDKDPSGNNVPQYDLGESIRIGVRVGEASHVYLFNIHSDGVVDQIFPNRLDNNNYLFAGETREFPPYGARYSFSIGEPEGIDKVIALASKQPLDTSTLAHFDSEAAFASAKHSDDSFAESLSIIVAPIEVASWVTDTAQFAIGEEVLASTNNSSTPQISNEAVTVSPTDPVEPSSSQSSDNSNTASTSNDNNSPPSVESVATNPNDSSTPSQTTNDTTAVDSTPPNNPSNPPTTQTPNEVVTMPPVETGTSANTQPDATSAAFDTEPQTPDETISTPVESDTSVNSSSDTTPSAPDQTITIAPVPTTEDPATTDSSTPDTSSSPSETITIAPVESEPSSTADSGNPNDSSASQTSSNTITIAPIDPSSPSTASVPTEESITTEEPITDASPPNTITISPLSVTPKPSETLEVKGSVGKRFLNH